MTADLAYTPAVELSRAIRARRTSSVEITQEYLRRIETLDPRLNSYLALRPEQALADARAADDAVARGWALGPLHGIPISVKDLEATADLPTTLGSAVFRDRPALADSIVVERVKAAGAIILGKTNTPEFGQSGTTENQLGPACRNPWDTARTPGGSSGGAGAALAAGLCPIATGSDGGGSIRIPASFSGVFGIKPTQGRVPRYGGHGRPAANHFSQSGPMSRTVADTALLLQVLAGPDSRDPYSMPQTPPDFSASLDRGVFGMRIVYSPDLGYAAVDPEVAAAAAQAARVFQELGARIDDTPLQLDDPFDAFFDVFATAAYTSYGHLFDEHREELSPPGRRSIEHGEQVTGADLSRALHRVTVLGRQMEDFFQTCDLLLTPTLATAAFEIGNRPDTINGRPVDPHWGFLPFTYPINMTGQTAASVPCGFTADGLPIGLHIIGPRGAEARVLQAAAAYERARPWADKRPPGFD